MNAIGRTTKPDCKRYLKPKPVGPGRLLPAVLILILQFFGNCDKFVDVDPPSTSTNAENVYGNDALATSVLIGIYTQLSSGAKGFTIIYSPAGGQAISMLAGLSADEFTLHPVVVSDIMTAYYRNELFATNQQSYGSEFWETLYSYIYQCNDAIEGLTGAVSLTPEVRTQLLGEAKFLRAFCYIYLTNLYGDVPLALTTNYETNAQLPRSPAADVYAQVIRDLEEAKELLSEQYVGSEISAVDPERLRPNKAAAYALLSRAYLYAQNWQKAEENASIVINNAATYELAPVEGVFLKDSRETIWQLQPVYSGWNTEDARIFIIPTTGFSDINPVYLSNELLKDFEANDLRRTSWTDTITFDGTDYYFPYKYKEAIFENPVSEYLVLLRVAEQYLVRAEARAQLGNLPGALEDLNAIRTRAGLTPLELATQPELLQVILDERKLEFFSEWGHRWIDLKRTGAVDSVMARVTPLKGGTWQPTDKLYPLPFNELLLNDNLVQNNGY